MGRGARERLGQETSEMKKKPAARPSKNQRTLEPGGVDEYIAGCPKESRTALKTIRASIRSVAPDALETLSYFDMPGYSYEGYAYNGMFVWFSFQAPHVRLHVRPAALELYSKDVKRFVTSKAVISFLFDKPIPSGLVKKLVRASLRDMKKKG